jgi:hypothetical protein
LVIALGVTQVWKTKEATQFIVQKLVKAWIILLSIVQKLGLFKLLEDENFGIEIRELAIFATSKFQSASLSLTT